MSGYYSWFDAIRISGCETGSNGKNIIWDLHVSHIIQFDQSFSETILESNCINKSTSKFGCHNILNSSYDDLSITSHGKQI